MAHEQLDPAHISTSFEQMRGERMPQGMWCYRFLDAATLTCESADSRDGGSRDGMSGNITGKQPVAGMSILPVRSEDIEQTRRQHHVAILTVFALVHTDDHALAVDVRDLQVDDFRHSQAGCVGSHQDSPMLQAGDGVEEGGDLLQAENDGEPDWLPGQWEILVTPVTFERHAVEEAQCADRRAETGGGQIALFAEVDEPGPDLLRTQQFG